MISKANGGPRLGALGCALRRCAPRTRLWLAVLCTSLAQIGLAQGMGVAVTPCGVKVGASGNQLSSGSTSSMEVKDYCVYNNEDKLGPIVRIPAAYVTGGVSSGGRIYTLWMEYWLPDFKPFAQLPERKLTPGTPEHRKAASESWEQRVFIQLFPNISTPALSTEAAEKIRDVRERVSPAPAGLERYLGKTCDRWSDLKRKKLPMENRQCDSVYSIEYFIGQSPVTNEPVTYFCQMHMPCVASTQVKGWYVQYSLAQSQLPQWAKIEQGVQEFLAKHIVTPAPTAK